jgi:hypothetical protein
MSDISFFKEVFNLSSDSLYTNHFREIFFLDESKYELHNKDFYKNFYYSFYHDFIFEDKDIDFISSKNSLKQLILS